jgi:N-methylhydantoinase B
VYYESPAGGNGGFAGGDGPSAFVNIDFGNLPSVQNVESIESEMPLLVEGCTLREDGGGEGRRRGGVGMIRRVRLLDAEASYSVLSDRAVIPPYGVLGGGSGAPYHLSVESERGCAIFDTPGKITGFPLRRDDVVVMRSSGGGGYGDPLDRPAEAVREDVLTGYVSAERARAGYGVVLTADGIDAAATERLRDAMRQNRFEIRVTADDTIDSYTGAKGRRRVLRLAAADMSRLGAQPGGLIEMLGRHPAPLRAWLLADAQPPGTIRLDAFARQVLGVADGDHVVLRAIDVPPLPNGMA